MDFEDIYRRQFPGVYRYLLALCGDPGLAEELAQETFVRAVQNSGAFRGDCKLSVWLCQIGKNCWYTYLRQKKRRDAAPLEELPEGSADSLESGFLERETAAQLHRRLHALPEPYREVFSLRVFAELNFSQIGELFGRSEGWARVTYHRAKLKLKEEYL